MVSQKLAAKVRASPGHFEQFSNIVNAGDFQEWFDIAAQDANGPVARRLLYDILPLLRISGGKVPFGPAERAQSLSEL